MEGVEETKEIEIRINFIILRIVIKIYLTGLKPKA